MTMSPEDICDAVAVALSATSPAETRRLLRKAVRDCYDNNLTPIERDTVVIAFHAAECVRYGDLGLPRPDPLTISEIIKRLPIMSLLVILLPGGFWKKTIVPGSYYQPIIDAVQNPVKLGYTSGKSSDPQGYVWGGLAEVKNYDPNVVLLDASSYYATSASPTARILLATPTTVGASPVSRPTTKSSKSKSKSKGTKMPDIKSLSLSDKPLQTIVYGCVLAFSRMYDSSTDADYAKTVWSGIGKALQDAGCDAKLLGAVTATLNAMNDTSKMPKFPIDETDTRYTSDMKEIAEALVGAVPQDGGYVSAGESKPVDNSLDLKLDIDPGMKPAIDAVFSKSNKQGVSFDDFMKKVATVQAVATKIEGMKRELADLRAKAAFAAPAASGGPVAASGTIPSGKLVQVSALDVFGKCAHGPNIKKMLGFEIPMFEWDGAHPHVPRLDDHFFPIETLVVQLWALLNNQPMWTHGPTGSGKSTGWMQIAARLGWPVHRVNFDAEITRLEFVGRDTLKTDGAGHTVSEFVEGVLPMAMNGPNILLLDEIDFVRPEVAAILMPVLETGTPLIVAENGGKVIAPNPMFRVVATSNTKGAGDETRTYQGTRPQSAALRNRFTGGFIEVNYMASKDEVALVKNKVPTVPDKVAATIVKLAGEVRHMFKAGDIIETCSPRDLFSIASTFTRYHALLGDEKASLRKAVDLHLIGRCGENDTRAINEVFQRVAA